VDGGRSDLAREWARELILPRRLAPAAASAPDDILVRQLDAMRHLAEGSGAAFVALTYPFPSGHHAQVRTVVLGGASTRGYSTLDLYEVFESRFSPEQWRAMRTPEDHVNPDGYALMGTQLADWAQEAGLLTP
jgi:hypothetical protein